MGGHPSLLYCYSCVAVLNSKSEIPLDHQFQVTKNTKGQCVGRQMQGPHDA